MTICIRPLVFADGDAAARIIYDAIQIGTRSVYSKTQRNAWAGTSPDPKKWNERFQKLDGFTAEISGKAVGFMTLNSAGYIDLAFVSPDRTGCGVGRKLYEAVEAKALAAGVSDLTTNASLVAKPFFQRFGWRIDCEQAVAIRGETLTNYRMSKQLSDKG
jgi:putative acetyltransferase